MTTTTLQASRELYRRIGHKVTGPLGIIKPVNLRRDKLESASLLLKNYNRELFLTRTSILVDLFPDELIIQEKTISVIKRDLFISSTQTITVKDIGVVYVDGIIFGTIEVFGKNTLHDLRIKGLNKARALKAKKIIEGLVLEDQQEIELPDWIQSDEHRELLVDAGNDPNEQNDTSRKSELPPSP